MTYVAAIDIGTHSALLLIGTLRGNRIEPEVDLARTTKLGEDLPQSKYISPAAMDRLIAVLRTYQAILSEYAVQQITVFGTAAFRLAENATECREEIARQFGWSLRVLSGDEEARYTFQGISQLLPPLTSRSQNTADSTGTVLAIDIGGGSTEVILGNVGQIHHQWSIPIGAVLLKQQFGPAEHLSATVLSRMEQFLMNHFAPIRINSPPRQVFITGGTATTLAALMQELEVYDFRRIDGYRCSLDKIDALQQELNCLTTAQRTDLPGMEPGRADVIVPAMVILSTLLHQCQCHDIVFTIRGARYGILKGL
jgi:exopolyphosphatase/guanosine-5'-triphosphate,3'-diphosphate pyrophosphatase